MIKGLVLTFFGIVAAVFFTRPTFTDPKIQVLPITEYTMVDSMVLRDSSILDTKFKSMDSVVNQFDALYYEVLYRLRKQQERDTLKTISSNL